MSTTISIQVGTLSAQRTFANDTKARDTLLLFFDSLELTMPGATNAQKLEAVIDWITKTINTNAHARYRHLQNQLNEQQADTNYGFE